MSREDAMLRTEEEEKTRRPREAGDESRGLGKWQGEDHGQRNGTRLGGAKRLGDG